MTSFITFLLTHDDQKQKHKGVIGSLMRPRQSSFSLQMGKHGMASEGHRKRVLFRIKIHDIITVLTCSSKFIHPCVKQRELQVLHDCD